MPSILFPTVQISHALPPDGQLVWVYCTALQRWQAARYDHTLELWSDPLTNERLNSMYFTHWAARSIEAA